MQLNGEIHLWTASIHALIDSHSDRFMSILSEAEHERLRRFRVEQPRRQSLAARGLLRTVLAQYLDQEPENIVFRQGQRGKPFIENTTLRFNLSHSEDRVIIGILAGKNIGVDVEHIHELPNMTTMARTNFSKSEQETLFSLPKSQQRLAFFTCWTRKEAYIKAVGDGFALPLRSFDVTFLPDDPPCILRAIGDDPQNWQLYDVSLDDAYVGAVCIQSKERDNLRLLDFHERR